MEQYNIFISVGGTANDKQEAFVQAVEQRLKSEGLIPNTVGRNKFRAEAPLKTIIDLMNDCSGCIIIALERTYFANGIEKRGGAKQSEVHEVKLATPWNHIEAAMAYAKDQPVIVIREKGLKSEGLLEKGHDWYVLDVDLEPSALTTLEFNGVFADWKDKVKLFNQNKTKTIKTIDSSSLTVGDIFKGLKPSNLWAILGVLATLLTGAFMLGKYLSKLL